MRCDGRSFDKVLEEAIDLGAEDVEEADDNNIRVGGQSTRLIHRCM